MPGSRQGDHTPEYKAIMNYAYHLDAGEVCAVPARTLLEKLGVRHVLANVTRINQVDEGRFMATSAATTRRTARSRATSLSIAVASHRCFSARPSA